MRFGITLLLLSSLLASFSGVESAAASYHGKTHAAYRKSHKRKAPPKEQQYFSFIPPKQPSALIEKLQTPLQGRIVQQQASPEPITGETLSTPTLEPLSAPAQPQISEIKAMEREELRKKQRTFKANQPFPERITPQHSWIEHLPTSDAAPMSEIVAHWIQTQITRAQSTLVLADPPQDQLKSNFIPNLSYALQKRGYAIARKSDSVPDAYWVRYRIRAFDKGLLVQVKINGQETIRLYERSQTGALVATSPMTFMRMGGQP